MMAKLEHAEYLKEFKAYMEEVNSSEEKATEFYIKAGIHTPTGRLKRVYYHRVQKAASKNNFCV